MPSKFETQLNANETLLRTILWAKIDYTTQDDASKKLLRDLWECGVMNSHNNRMTLSPLAAEIIKDRMRAERATQEDAEMQAALETAEVRAALA